MSMMATVIRPDRVTLYADGAFYDPDTGVLTNIARKVWLLPGMQAAFSSRGFALHFPVFAMVVRDLGFKSFDELVAGLDDVWRAFDLMVEGTTGEILIVGWSEKFGKPVALFRCTHGSNEALDPGRTYVFDDGVVSFGCSADLWAMPQDIDDAEAVRVFSLARKHIDDLHCGESDQPFMGYSVGGRIDKVTVTADAVRLDHVHDWPDVIGEPIDPTREGREPGWLEAA